MSSITTIAPITFLSLELNSNNLLLTSYKDNYCMSRKRISLLASQRVLITIEELLVKILTIAS